MTPDAQHATLDLLRAVQMVLHLTDIEPSLARATRLAALQLSRAATGQLAPHCAPRAVDRLDTDLGLVACHVGLTPSVARALQALEHLRNVLEPPRCGPSWHHQPLPTWEPG